MPDRSAPSPHDKALRSALRAAGHAAADAPLEPLADTGLAHAHVRLAGTGLLARIPKQSQLGLPAAEHLSYEATCFERAAPSGHVPRLHVVLPPQPGLPRGALVVEEIVGRPARLPQDLPAIAATLASLHALPLPADPAPLRAPVDPLAALRDEVLAQTAYLPEARLEDTAARHIAAELDALRDLAAAPARPPRRLIAFDGHPGNYLVRADGRAMLVDLEKARYGPPPLDLAHATLYTSTTWDAASHAVLDDDDLAAFHGAWLTAQPDAAAHASWIVPLRRAMWLWSVTWCAKWRVLSERPASAYAGGEDWSADLSDAALVQHVRERVDHYLSAAIVERVCDESRRLRRRLP